MNKFIIALMCVMTSISFAKEKMSVLKAEEGYYKDYKVQDKTLVNASQKEEYILRAKLKKQAIIDRDIKTKPPLKTVEVSNNSKVSME